MTDTIKIVRQTIDNAWHEMEVKQSEAANKMEQLRMLPDVKAETVRTSL